MLVNNCKLHTGGLIPMYSEHFCFTIQEEVCPRFVLTDDHILILQQFAFSIICCSLIDVKMHGSNCWYEYMEKVLVHTLSFSFVHYPSYSFILECFCFIIFHVHHDLRISQHFLNLTPFHTTKSYLHFLLSSFFFILSSFFCLLCL